MKLFFTSAYSSQPSTPLTKSTTWSTLQSSAESTTFNDLGERSSAEEDEGTVGLPAAESELLESATDSASLCSDAAVVVGAAAAAVGRKWAK